MAFAAVPGAGPDTVRFGHSVIEARRPAADPDAFREAMSRLAGGVAVVACLDEDQSPRGLLVSSITCLSTEPPRMLFCVRKAAGAHDALLKAKVCSIAILAEGEAEEAARFSASHRVLERFASDDWRITANAPPVYERALVGLVGRVAQRIDAGSHSLLMVDVDRVAARDAAPLVYFSRGFRSLAAEG